jgi:hypothetical protein
MGSNEAQHWEALNAIKYLQRKARITFLDYIQSVLAKSIEPSLH